MELLTNQSLSSRLRIPAGSRLQKIHNVDLALTALNATKSGLPSSITSKNIVEGHLEKTLGLMWHIIFGFQLERILDVDKLQREIKHLQKSLRWADLYL